MSEADRTLGLLCTTRSFGGIELNVLRLARWLIDRGNPCSIYALCESPLRKKCRSQSVPCFELPSDMKYFSLRNVSALRKLLLKHNTDILITNATRDINLAVLTRILSGNRCHLIHAQHMQIGRSKRNAFHAWEYRHLDAWIAPLPWLAKQTQEMTTVSEKKIHVIPFGIELSRYLDGTDKQTARHSLGLPSGACIIGTVGRLDKGKDQETLLRALAMLPRTENLVHALIVGQDTIGEQQNYGIHLRELAHELGIYDRVHFRPFMENIEVAFQAIDIFVLTSVSETYGMVTIEAMASGLPIIATNTAGTPEILSHDVDGFLFPPMEPTMLAEKLNLLMNDTALRQRFSTTARKKALDRFSHFDYCHAVEQLCASIRNQSHR